MVVPELAFEADLIDTKSAGREPASAGVRRLIACSRRRRSLFRYDFHVRSIQAFFARLP